MIDSSSFEKAKQTKTCYASLPGPEGPDDSLGCIKPENVTASEYDHTDQRVDHHL